MVVALLAASTTTSAFGQVQSGDNQLPLSLAMEAAAEAVQVCASQGWPVSVTIVDTAGNVKLQAKGDHSTVHTKETSFRKAYTVVTLGPIFNFETLGAFAEKMRSNPAQASFLTVANIILLPGAVAVKSKGEIVAAIGVGGAPGGDKDEACAAAGLAKIRDRLPH